MKTSNHAKTRIKERCGLGKDSGDRLAAIALEKGLKRNEANGQLKDIWISCISLIPMQEIFEYMRKKFGYFPKTNWLLFLEFPKVLRIKPIRKSKENQERRIIWETKNT